MFFLRRPSRSQIEDFLAVQREQGFSYSEVGFTRGFFSTDYKVDHNRAHLGNGHQTFLKAQASLRSWRMFELGWVELFPARTPIDAGMTVAVLASHVGLWSLNACRIVYTVEEERRFGFAYGTLQDHSEQGEERFSVEWSADDDSVCYDVLALSKPKTWQARALPPLTRMFQRRFARDSMAAMKRAVLSADTRYI